jgi:hypothetical protein
MVDGSIRLLLDGYANNRTVVSVVLCRHFNEDAHLEELLEVFVSVLVLDCEYANWGSELYLNVSSYVLGDILIASNTKTIRLLVCTENEHS